MAAPHAPAATEPDVRAIMQAWSRQQGAMASEMSRFFMNLDLTMAQFRVLAAIRRWGRLTGRDLAGRLGVTPGTLIPLFDRLEERGYLRRVPDPTDRRLTWLELTPQGERLFSGLFRFGAQKLMAAIAQLAPADRRTYQRLLNEIADYLEAHSTVGS